MEKKKEKIIYAKKISEDSENLYFELEQPLEIKQIKLCLIK